MGIIYCARNKHNGRRYIGQSRNSLDKKKRYYEGSARRTAQPGNTEFVSLLTKALWEFGEDAFEWTVLFDDVEEEDLDQLEIDTIAVYKTQVPNGYNLMTGGTSNGTHSAETKKKMIDAQLGKKHGPRSEETRKRLCEAHRRRKPPSEETRKAMSESHIGKKMPTFSDEHRKKISEAARQRWAKRRTEQTEKENIR